eukprot:2810534-Amphidinium_carterae.2
MRPCRRVGDSMHPTLSFDQSEGFAASIPSSRVSRVNAIVAYKAIQSPQTSRILRPQMSEQFGIPISEITTDRPIFPWMVKHVGILQDKFQLGQNGQPPYSRTWGQKYKSAINAFGETLQCQDCHHDNQKIPVRLEPQCNSTYVVTQVATHDGSSEAVEDNKHCH